MTRIFLLLFLISACSTRHFTSTPSEIVIKQLIVSSDKINPKTLTFLKVEYESTYQVNFRWQAYQKGDKEKRSAGRFWGKKWRLQRDTNFPRVVWEAPATFGEYIIKVTLTDPQEEKAEREVLVTVSNDPYGFKKVWEEDFSKDPGWKTNRPDIFSWNKEKQVYQAQFVPGAANSYAYIPLPVPYQPDKTPPFALQFDIYIELVDTPRWEEIYFTFGLFDEDMNIGKGSNCYLKVEADRYSRPFLSTEILIYGRGNKRNRSSSTSWPFLNQWTSGVVRMKKGYFCWDCGRHHHGGENFALYYQSSEREWGRSIEAFFSTSDLDSLTRLGFSLVGAENVDLQGKINVFIDNIVYSLGD
jgi:hypothetical protein